MTTDEINKAEDTVEAALHPSRLVNWVGGPTPAEDKAAWTLAKAWLAKRDGLLPCPECGGAKVVDFFNRKVTCEHCGGSRVQE